jgi:CheY-like chemotaxis protein
MPLNADQADLQRPRVALCEPDALLRALLGEWLRRHRCEPVDGTAAAPAGNVVLVVADVAAPRQDGAACVVALRRKFPHARLLAISGQFMPGLQGAPSAAFDLGADAVLAKPFTAQGFMSAVQALLGS